MLDMVFFPTYYPPNKVGIFTTWYFKQTRRVEMNRTLLASMLALGITVVSTSVMALDLGAIRQGRGADDPAGHIRQGRGADDIGGMRGLHADGHISGRDRVRVPRIADSSGRRGRGADDPVGHIRQGRGADDVGGVRGLHADGHISGRDRVRSLSGMGAAGLLGR
jgi:hypothetical protein